MEEESGMGPSNEMDKLTLQLLTNKRSYNKYLSQNDPAQYKEIQLHNSKKEKYASRIMNIAKVLLENHDLQITTEVNESFHGFLKTCFKYFEMRELEKKTNGGCYENDYVSDTEKDDDALFPVETHGSDSDSDDNAPFVVSDKTNKGGEKISGSYWGKSVKKMNHMTMDMFVKPKKR